MVERFKSFDWVLIATVFALSVFGLIMVYSASYPLSIDLFDSSTYYIVRQLIYFGLGIIIFAVLMNFRYHYFKMLSPYIIAVSVVLLLLVVFIGVAENEATRWVNIGGISMQPSELVKLGVIIYLAQVYSQKQKYIDRFATGVAPPLIVVVALFTLILLQPDLGTAVMILLVGGVIVFLSGARFRHLAFLGTLSAAVVLFLVTQADYRMNRILAFRDPFAYDDSFGLQLIQSYISLANGGLTGTGFGQSVQKLGYLPEAHTDFILAIIAEETGWIGVGFVILCFLVIGFRGLIIGARCKNLFGSLLAYGIVFQLMFQFIFNAGAVSGLLPITGIPLPFVSYGGTSLIVSLASAAILVNISLQNQKDYNNREQEMEGPPHQKESLVFKRKWNEQY
ncbi:putative lipid II flippase FtsW [Salicibibacter halophilus]|uniref:Probable peptidoglycan glycosyltransferase FtsW n=1 Tax=Salicibibacter halophilus TaxID=2502791 RepID=A0A514LH98_9BACI|nr:putative lipid II flippase FtsW [Salicibibacter halophilus]QDI91228.1 putative lipid II flippase FtsW [Salicibibacter halophilus]